MLAECGGRYRRLQVLAPLVLAAACGTTPPPLEGLQAVQVPYSAAPALRSPAAARISAATTLAEYQREIAALLHAASPGRVYEGVPPNPLRAVVVYYAEIDSRGDPGMVLLFRAPEHSLELADYAAASIQRTAPFPRPHPRLMNGVGRVAFTESWLFGYDDRFRLRTLSLPQEAVPTEEGDEETP